MYGRHQKGLTKVFGYRVVGSRGPVEEVEEGVDSLGTVLVLPPSSAAIQGCFGLVLVDWISSQHRMLFLGVVREVVGELPLEFVLADISEGEEAVVCATERTAPREAVEPEYTVAAVDRPWYQSFGICQCYRVHQVVKKPRIFSAAAWSSSSTRFPESWQT